MGSMSPCVQCGGKVKATMKPLWGWYCPECKAIYTALQKDEMNLEQLQALLGYYDDYIDHLGTKLEEAGAENKELREALNKQVEYGVQALANVSELNKDKARLDWLDANEGKTWAVDWGLGLWDGADDKKRTLREAVDLDMAKGEL